VIGDWEQLLCDPFAKSVGDAADIRADWSCGPSPVFHAFVNFIEDIELSKWAGGVGLCVFFDIQPGRFGQVRAV
jgi:hypothetical protein